MIGAFAIFAVRFLGTTFDYTGSYRFAFAGLLALSTLIWIAALLIDLRADAKC